MKMWFCSLGLILFATGAPFLIGCGEANGRATPKGFPEKKPVENLPTVENRNYANWTLFPVGTMVKKVKMTKNPQDWVKETTITRLLEKNPEKVIVETLVTVERPNYPTQVNPATKNEIISTFRVPKGMTAEQIQAPSLKARNTGPEEVEVLGKKEKAIAFTWEDGTESGPMVIKAWFAETVPGRLVRQEMTVEKKGFKAVEEIVELSIPMDK